ncbi:MAG TPA: crossover junction endodeoxyribonuclease RuvC [Lapillicoccus sp.]|nr:crossover junction endodeoxyribonuclease RuvC [Lapillicoccus sp.]
MRVLGVDPGLTRCGIGVVEGAPGRPLRMVDVDVFRTATSLPTAERLLSLQTDIDQWVRRYHPDAVAIERVFADVNMSTVMGTAQASAVAMLAAASRGIPVHLHTPTEVKAAVTGSGRADKAQVTAMVTRLLRLPEPPKPPDAADALALAICHLWRGGAQARLDAAVAARAGTR